MNPKQTLRIAFLCAIASAFAACGGGGGGGGGGGTGGGPLPVTSPTPTPTLAPSSGSTTITVGAQPASTALPAAGGYSGTIRIPTANTSATLNVGASTLPPSGVSAPQMRREATVTTTPLLYLTLTAQASVTLDGSPQITVTLPNGISTSQSFYLALLVPNQGWMTFSGPGSISGQTVTFAGHSGTIALIGGTPVQLVLYAGAPLGSDPLTISPSPVQLLATNATQTISIGDLTPPAGFTLTNTFVVSASTCQGVATIARASTSTFLISAMAAGTCSISIADSYGYATAVPVSVTGTTVIGQ